MKLSVDKVRLHELSNSGNHCLECEVIAKSRERRISFTTQLCRRLKKNDKWRVLC